VYRRSTAVGRKGRGERERERACVAAARNLSFIIFFIFFPLYVAERICHGG